MLLCNFSIGMCVEERLARLEGKTEELSKRIEEGLNLVNKRIDDLETVPDRVRGQLSQRA